MDFRKILKSKPKGYLPQDCKSKSSPVCLVTFIKTREEQISCIKCLAHNDLLEAHPRIDV